MLGCCSGWVLCKNRCLADLHLHLRPILRQSVTGISCRLSHFVSALHPYLASPACSQPFGIFIGVLWNRKTLGLSLLHPYFLFFPLFSGVPFPFLQNLQYKSLELLPVFVFPCLCTVPKTPFRCWLFFQLGEPGLAIWVL